MQETNQVDIAWGWGGPRGCVKHPYSDDAAEHFVQNFWHASKARSNEVKIYLRNRVQNSTI
ncbi:hypothetical protein D8674_028647 [Pyrus ussuriensis x Pyrus communis]|uniref:Uncharacterized protein n=1 Tax=Pyrus ussuriensis x Pyrus communis TaxID=2448454 RepID=A0A5N5I457_9ROSA|nr:hypothetical protein D8674_028647 [Pyrus ussuriensis x Pyrus communis]